MRFTKHLFLCLICFCLASCSDKKIVHSETENIPNGVWTYANATDFEFPINDTLEYYHLDLFLDHDASFAYQNLYVKIKSTFPDGRQNEDLVSLELADKTGLWIGDCNSKNCLAPFQLKSNIRFSQLGNHQFQISQNSRQDSLVGFNSVTMKLIKATD